MKASVLNKTPISEQEPSIRNRNFEEVVLGYTLEEAILESQRCLECKNAPCRKGCPVGVDIPAFIHELKSGDVATAYTALTKDNALPAICGRVCPQENQCEGKCVRAIKGESVGIGRLERFVADYIENADTYSLPICEVQKPYKVAVVGSGPAGLTCAVELAKAGVKVTLFEALQSIGGVLTYGIPEFRLPKALVEREREKLEALGVEIKVDTLIGRSYTIEQLKQSFDGIFIGSGAGLPKFLGIEGENLNGVYSANEYLTRVNLMKAFKNGSATPIKRGKNVAVIGGGNVAMDAARTAMRLGAENVYIVYRRSIDELPARLEEIHHAKEEGIQFLTLNNPKAILGHDHMVTGLKCQTMALGEPDASGRRRPIPVEDDFKEIACDTVIIAIGQTPNPLIKMSTPDIETYDWGGISVDEATMMTNLEGVYAGGDAVTGAATVIKAMGAGKTAAMAMLEKFN